MTTPNTDDIVALRKELFASLNRLAAGKSDPDEIARAKAVAETAQVIINSAKVEVDFIRATGNPGGSGFIPLADRPGLPATLARLKG